MVVEIPAILVLFLPPQSQRQAPTSPSRPLANPFFAVHELLPSRPFDFHDIDLTDVAGGDFDGDGDLDLVLGMIWLGDWGDSPMQATLLLHERGGRFRDAQERWPRVLSFPQEMGAADVDNDGDLDLLVTNGGAGIIPDQLFLNEGPRFGDRSANLPLDYGRGPVRFGDVDGDGDPDVLFPRPSSWIPELHRNDGSGVFAASSSIPAAHDLGNGSLTDVDSDGDLDVLFSRAGKTTLWHNDGTGSFVDASLGRTPNAGRTDFATGDVDGDLDPDLVAANFMLRNDAGVFTGVPGPASTGPVLALVDVDGDGDRDAFGPRDLALNDGQGLFTSAPGRVPSESNALSAFAVGDFDVDGDVDALVTEEGVYLGSLARRADYLLLNDGSGQFTDSRSIDELPDSYPESYDSRLADLDGDRIPDLLLIRAASLELHAGDGTGFFGSPRVLARPGAEPSLPKVLDVNGDQAPDLLIASQAGLALYLGPNLALSTTALTTPLVGFAAGDLDGDGDPDVVTREATGARLLLNQGGGVFAFAPSGSLPSLPNGPSDVRLADLEGDGALDIVFAGNALALYQNDGAARFTDVTAARIGTVGAERVALADVDRDGDADLVTGSSYNQALFLNDGTGSFEIRPDGIDGTRAEPGGHLLLDGDLDGDPDLLGIHSGIWQENQGGRYSRVTRLVNLGVPNVGDVDLDGDDDLLPGPSEWSGRLTSPILRNRSRHLAWRTLPSVGEPLEFVVFGPPSEPYALWFATTRRVTHDNAGTLFLDRATRSEVRSGTLDASGRATVTVPIPDDPSLLGTVGYWQAAVGKSAHYTNHERIVLSGL